jgi:hypothetical protein
LRSERLAQPVEVSGGPKGVDCSELPMQRVCRVRGNAYWKRISRGTERQLWLSCLRQSAFHKTTKVTCSLASRLHPPLEALYVAYFVFTAVPVHVCAAKGPRLPPSTGTKKIWSKLAREHLQTPLLVFIVLFIHLRERRSSSHEPAGDQVPPKRARVPPGTRICGWRSFVVVGRRCPVP